MLILLSAERRLWHAGIHHELLCRLPPSCPGKFYETFGDEIANELVEWFNAVDATYRADLRELNELNFARFAGQLGQRFAEQDSRWERRIAELRTELQVGLERLETRLTKRLFGFWIAQAATTVGLVFGVLQLLRQ